jgi:hypothetical protein
LDPHRVLEDLKKTFRSLALLTDAVMPLQLRRFRKSALRRNSMRPKQAWNFMRGGIFGKLAVCETPI